MVGSDDSLIPLASLGSIFRGKLAVCFREGKYTRILVYGCIWYVLGRSHSKLQCP